jgi:hypothetical protein
VENNESERESLHGKKCIFSWGSRTKCFTDILPRATVAHIVQVPEIRNELSRAKATIAGVERELLQIKEKLKTMSDEIARLAKENQGYCELLQQAPARVSEICA